MLAATFSAPLIPAPFFAVVAPFLPLLAWKRSARWLRKAARFLVREDAASLSLDLTAWHTYRLVCREDRAFFWVDGAPVFETAIVPRGRLGLVIWIDNQFAAFPPNGQMSFGTLAAQSPAWLEIADLALS
jgi:hypothetical protein